MNCSNCGRANDSDSNFCKNCGTNLHPDAIDPNRTIFDNPHRPQAKSNIDLGYLIIAILILANVFVWLFWSFVSGSIINSDNRMLFMVVRILPMKSAKKSTVSN